MTNSLGVYSLCQLVRPCRCDCVLQPVTQFLHRLQIAKSLIRADERSLLRTVGTNLV